MKDSIYVLLTALLKLCAILSVKQVVTVHVTLDGPKYVKNGEQILVNCSSDSTPVGKSAEFLIDDKSYTNLVTQTNGCYSGIMRKFCVPDVCECSHDGKMFILLIDHSKIENFTKISCVMKFAEKTGYILKGEDIIVQHIDVKGPFISTEPEQPLTAGTVAHLICNLISPIRNFNITWDCFGLAVQNEVRINETFLVSKANLVVKSEHKGKPCHCIVSTGNIVLSTNINLNVANLPILNIVGDRECNETSVLLLSCLLSGELKQYGFGDWIHTFNGTFIRRLSGRRYGNISVLTINSCKYQDGGEYLCTAWNNYSVGIFFTNSSTTVSINGPPTIIEVNIFKDIGTLISLIVYSVSSIYNMQWLVNDTPLGNDSNIYISTSQDTICTDIYGVSMQRPGYVYNLTIRDNTPGIYEVQLSNTYGKTRRQITIDGQQLKGHDFNLGTVTWVLALISVFILTCLFGILSSYRGHQTGLCNWYACIGRKIYFTAPQPPQAEMNMRTYDTTEPHYHEIRPEDELPNPVIDIDSRIEDVSPYLEPIY